jgi:hypothetical protein
MRTLSLWHSGAFLCALGCSEATGTDDAPVAGTYVLESVDGCEPGLEAQQCFPRPSWVVEGTMVLTVDGGVSRTMRYQLPSDPQPASLVATGTYSRVGDLVLFALREDGGAASHTWRASADHSDGRLRLRYPHPADGETVEIFRRQ